MSRPTDYNPEILQKAKDYLAKAIDDEYTVGDKERPIYKIRVKLPSIEGCAVFLGIHKDTIYEWEKIHPEFSDVIEALRATQAERLINEGLAGTYNPTISKLLLAKHGYVEKSEHEINDKRLIVNDDTADN